MQPEARGCAAVLCHKNGSIYVPSNVLDKDSATKD